MGPWATPNQLLSQPGSPCTSGFMIHLTASQNRGKCFSDECNLISVSSAITMHWLIMGMHSNNSEKNISVIDVWESEKLMSGPSVSSQSQEKEILS